MANAQLEALDGEVREVLYSLEESKVKDVIIYLKITAGTEGKSRHTY